jgi:thiol-disulfide isomerase/thioredoxin
MSNTPAGKKRPRAWLWIVVGVLVGLVTGFVLLTILRPGGFFGNEPDALAPSVPLVDSPAPDFELNRLDGSPVSLSSLRGRTLILNFWATWCGPCRLEMPLLQQVQQQYGEQVVVLTVNHDEPPEVVQGFVDELNLDLNVLLDPQARVAGLYKVRGFPSTVFIDPEGVIRYVHIGLLSEGALRGYLEELGVSL